MRVAVASTRAYTALQMDNDFSIDLSDIAETIRSSDLIAMRFVSLGQRLLLDFRSSEIDGPMVRVVPPVRSVEERYETLKRLRPRFDAPGKIHALWWPRYTRSLKTTGVWDEVMQRVTEAGHPDAVRRAWEALEQLIAAEDEAQRQAIRGDGYRTLWTATAKRRQD